MASCDSIGVLGDGVNNGVEDCIDDGIICEGFGLVLAIGQRAVSFWSWYPRGVAHVVLECIVDVEADAVHGEQRGGGREGYRIGQLGISRGCNYLRGEKIEAVVNVVVVVVVSQLRGCRRYLSQNSKPGERVKIANSSAKSATVAKVWALFGPPLSRFVDFAVGEPLATAQLFVDFVRVGHSRRSEIIAFGSVRRLYACPSARLSKKERRLPLPVRLSRRFGPPINPNFGGPPSVT